MIELRRVNRVYQEHCGCCCRTESVLQYRNGTPIETHPEARTTRIEYIWTDWKDVPIVEEE